MLGQIQRDFRRVIVAAAVGNIIEWYDFYIFGSLAAVLSVKFFEKSHPVAALLSTIALFTAGFLVRPLGTFLFGWLGDRVGRKYTFMITLTGMGLGTGLIGLIPTFQSIGIAAAIILFGLRIIQGLCLGDEYGGHHLCRRARSGRAPRLLHRPAADFAHARHHRVDGRHRRHACLFRPRRIQRMGLAHAVPGVLYPGGHRDLYPAPTPGDPDLRGNQGQRPDGQESMEGSLRQRQHPLRAANSGRCISCSRCPRWTS